MQYHDHDSLLKRNFFFRSWLQQNTTAPVFSGFETMGAAQGWGVKVVDRGWGREVIQK